MKSKSNPFALHPIEYLIEGALLGAFLVSACFCAVAIEHPGSVIRQHVEDPFIRRVLMGFAMGVTAILLIKSPLGRRSGAHMNPAVTLTYFRLGKIKSIDALVYILFQAVGGILGVRFSLWILGSSLGDPSVNFVATHPGMAGLTAAWIAEFGISLVLMTVVLALSNNARWMTRTPLVVGLLIAIYIALEAPISGMSMNPARTLGSALSAKLWTGFWIYLTAPTLAMLLASEIHLRLSKCREVYCAKLCHDTTSPCIFNCRFHELMDSSASH